ncbi:hypothetical protein [Paenibacillus crassostreae]|uniref:UbiD family decarboxylase n=1 Tax=Paenibacillus crassostreae TaxID=1763538 RepID=A0A162KW20_9BACL|nr:hypothetical protein [Paenibacillus crassostreae]AOZ90964.1 hypothetical protein LPB68_01270 [Paenibacillus crassostreae]OAB74873.1 hypothetical protein PNBC_12685 [Paenibacillus crassostreae]
MERLDKEDMRERIATVKTRISEIASDPSKSDLKEFYVMGLITPILDDLGADPAIIVGGHAVELYTSGSYKTADIDLVMIRDDLARDLFDRLGFVREGRFHYVTEMDIPIEIPSNDLAGSKDRIVKLNTPDGYCYVIGVEDLIMDRLNAAEFWSDARSLEWARYLMSSQFESLDLDYMRKRAEADNPELLQRLELEYNWVQENMKD